MVVPFNHNFKVTTVGLNFSGVVPFDTWQDIGPALGRGSRAFSWGIGDWLVYGEKMFPDRYSQAMDSTGLSLGRLRNLTSLANNVALHVRRENLSLSHHEAVIPLPEQIQIEMLDIAEKHDLDRDTLRSLVAEVQAGVGPEDLEIDEQEVVFDPASDAEIAEQARHVILAWRGDPGASVGMTLHQAMDELDKLVGENV